MVIWCRAFGTGPLRQWKRKPAATTTWASLSNWQQEFFYMHHPRQHSKYHSFCYTSHGAVAGTRTQWVHHEGSIRRPISPWVDTLPRSNKGCGMCYPVCGMVHIKEPLLLIGNSSLCGVSWFTLSLSEWPFITCLTPYNRK